jgi:hypothetical protein
MTILNNGSARALEVQPWNAFEMKMSRFLIN